MQRILTGLFHILRLFCYYGPSLSFTQAAQQDADEGVEDDEEGAEKGQDEDKPEEPVVETRASKGSKKGKRGKGKGGRDDLGDNDGDVLDPLAHLKGDAKREGKGEADPDDGKERPKKPLTKKEKRRLEEQRLREMEVRQHFLFVPEVMSTHELMKTFSGA